MKGNKVCSYLENAAFVVHTWLHLCFLVSTDESATPDEIIEACFKCCSFLFMQKKNLFFTYQSIMERRFHFSI